MANGGSSALSSLFEGISPLYGDIAQGIVFGSKFASYVGDYFKQNENLKSQVNLMRGQYALYQLQQNRRNMMRSTFMTDATMKARQGAAAVGNGFAAAGIDANAGTAADMKRRVENAIYTQAVMKAWSS